MERRVDQRRRVLKKGSIEFGGSAIDCSIGDVGAMLDLAWVKGKRWGVEFER